MSKSTLIVSAVFPPEPVVSAKLSYDLALSLSEQHNVIVISPVPTRPYGFAFDGEKKQEPFEHHLLKSFTCPESKMLGRLKETYSFGQACYRFISENHLRIGHIYSNTWPLFAQYYTVKAAKKYNIPITIHIQDIYPESLSNKVPIAGKFVDMILMPIDKYIFKYASHIIAISEKMRTYLLKTRQVPAEKISVVANWQDEMEFIDRKSWEVQSSIKSGIFTFMYLGNLGPVAGVDFLIECFTEAKLENCRLVIAGAGSMKSSLERQVAENPEINIAFWNVPEGKVHETQKLADVMLLPMKKGAASSSIPSKLPAYMLSKKPVIASVEMDSDTSQTIKIAECGWVISAENKEALINCLKKVAEMDKDELQKRGERGFKFAIDNFSKATNLKKLRSIIDKFS